MGSLADTIIEAQVIEALRSCFDPEIPVNIYELGLVYNLEIVSGGVVKNQMALTWPPCPAMKSLPAEVEKKVRGVVGVTGVIMDLVWEQPWEPSRMSEAARLQLGML